MAGLILLGALSLFVVLLFWFSGFLMRRLPIAGGWKALLRLMVVAGIFPLLLADELIGRHQFDSLCKANRIEAADLSKARGKRVTSEYGARKSLQGTALPIKEFDVIFRDVESNDVLIRYKSYHAMGGWLMRYTPLSMGGARPLLFTGSCTVDYAVRDAIFRQNNVSLINKGG